ncbi:hypothetical protein EJ03DRAFT_283100 [Teratosphaeria nubilosa]|uniref:Uncharacterized protein n=1 Tax=Teratosphaeria nubilosa TaxID=161662 RepID=A0A6G1KTD0_9PEZI|nr:hypothetical protein EJ03DRAFT_283100 [Teratosphaeria nubilosa]
MAHPGLTESISSPSSAQKLTTFGDATAPSYFELVAVNYAYAFHLEKVQGTGDAIYIGGNSSHYCPLESEPDNPCPNTAQTDFLLSGGSLAMGAEVPGGQACYIDPDVFTLNYTTPHSGYMPTDAITTGWWVRQDSPFFYELHYDLGIYACPTINATVLPWALFAVNQTVNASIPAECAALQLILRNATTADAWEYL